ncbi:DUF624 domain-containing protein [Kribbella deserti]|uniref:DUF624 domain-containing protein n=1 Tax=Kribbella deserti TaxID=1926257 RepID=A0ABV6QTE3_9ACTN
MNDPARRLTLSADTWDLLWSFVHRILVVNLGLVLGCLPLLIGLLAVAEPWRYPIFFGLLAVLAGPAVAAAFSYLNEEDSRPPVRLFVRAYRRHWRRALAVAAVVTALVGVLVADIAMLYDAMPGAALVPLLVVLAVLLVSAGSCALALLPDSNLGLRSVARVAVYAAVRGWQWSLVSLVVAVVALVLVNQAPLLGLTTVPGCAAWVMLINARFQLNALSLSVVRVGQPPV